MRLFCARFALLVAPDHLPERALRRCRGFAMVKVASERLWPYAQPKMLLHVIYEAPKSDARIDRKRSRTWLPSGVRAGRVSFSGGP